jgi:hypothetical protein
VGAIQGTVAEVRHLAAERLALALAQPGRDEISPLPVEDEPPTEA